LAWRKQKKNSGAEQSSAGVTHSIAE